VAKAAVRRALLALAQRTAELRERRGLTQQDLAERAELSLRYIQKVEAGEANLSFENLVALSLGLNVELRALFDDAAPRPRRKPGRPRVRR
jgi:transcriptional regulator with XRE-family HTH domain